MPGGAARPHQREVRDRPVPAGRPGAFGYFVHVYVDRASRRPVPVPDAARALLADLVVGGHNPE